MRSRLIVHESYGRDRPDMYELELGWVTGDGGMVYEGGEGLW